MKHPPISGMRLATRLFVAQSVALLAAVATAALVAALIGPALFHTHLLASGQDLGQPAQTHIEEAFASASAVSLGIGLLVALILALAVTWYVTGRIRRPLDTLGSAARRISTGDYSVHVSVTDAGPELASLGQAFNQMAERLGGVEETRRRLLSDLAHELRTPIATLTAYLEGLGDGVLEWDDEALATLSRQAERLTRLARDLDDVSRAEEGRIAVDAGPHPLEGVVADAVRQFGLRFEAAGVELVDEVTPTSVWADPQRVAQILTNLLSNALRHTPAGGRVAVSGGGPRDPRVPGGPRRGARAAGADGMAVLTVTDTGEGMTPDQVPRVFERFYRGDTARARDAAGSGIGLTIARAMARAQGGELTASSAGLGRGSTFTLTLPTGPAGSSAPRS